MYTWKKDLCPSSDSRPEGILNIVHLEEAQELEEEVMISLTIFSTQNQMGQKQQDSRFSYQV
jgi:hypothetical protein